MDIKGGRVALSTLWTSQRELPHSKERPRLGAQEKDLGVLVGQAQVTEHIEEPQALLMRLRQWECANRGLCHSCPHGRQTSTPTLNELGLPSQLTMNIFLLGVCPVARLGHQIGHQWRMTAS